MDRLLGHQDVQDVTGLGKTTIQRMEARGEFPRRRQIARKRVGWLASEVDEWMATRPAAPPIRGRGEERTDA